MNVQILSNVLKFLERVNVSGLESYAWCEAHQALQTEIARLSRVEAKSAIDANTGA